MQSSVLEKMSRSLHEESDAIDSFGLEISDDIKLLYTMCVYESASEPGVYLS